MKTFLKLVLSSSFAVCTAFSLFAATRTVSNNPNIPAQYINLQEAINASASGDTLLIHGSSTSYGNVSISKSIVMIGPGYKPVGQNQLLAQIGTININAASAGLSDNVMFIGLSIADLRPHNGGCGTGHAVKMTAQRCVITTISPSGVQLGENDSEFEALQCIFTSTFNGANVGCGGAGLATILITNSIFTGSFSYNTTVSNGVISNCVLLGASSVLGNIQNTIFSNNVFYGSQLANTAGAKTNCVFNSNLTFSTTNNSLIYPASITAGTLENINPLFITANPPNNGANFTILLNSNLNLQATSPLLSAGTDGTDIGITGGSAAFNYLLQGATKGPYMTSLTISNAAVLENGILEVSFTAKAQD